MKRSVHVPQEGITAVAYSVTHCCNTLSSTRAHRCDAICNGPSSWSSTASHGEPRGASAGSEIEMKEEKVVEEGGGRTKDGGGCREDSEGRSDDE